MTYEELQAENARLNSELAYDKRIQLYVDKLVAEYTQHEVEKLQAENARLKTEVERLTKELADEKSANANVENRQQDHLRGLSMENFNLKAEVERLQQEKNELVVMIHPIVLKALNAAKEGKPSV